MRRFGQKKENKNIWIPLFIIGIMVLSALGYAVLQGNENSIKVHGVKFVKTQDNFWVAKIKGVSYMFYFSPEDVKALQMDNFTLPTFVYLTSNPEANYSRDNLMTIESAKFELKNSLLAAGYTAVMNFSNKITCKNANPATAVVDLDLGNETKIVADGNCILVRGTDAVKLVAARDKFLMRALGVY